jgi:drug/metabolite transporter (DMT)-like permease
MIEQFGSFVYLGESLSVLTAIIWAVAVILFKKSGESVHPLALNLFKNLLAFGLMLLTMSLLGRSFVQANPLWEYVLLFISGFIGIGIADTVFFRSLNILGAGNAAIVGCIYSPVIILLSVIFLGDKISLFHFIGTGLILSAVFLIADGTGIKGITKKHLIEGIALSVISQVLMASGLVMIKGILNTRDLFWITEIRFLGGLTAIFIILLFSKNRKKILLTLNENKEKRYTIWASFIGAYLALIIWLSGMKYTQVSRAAVLNQLSEIFIFILAAVYLHEKITFKKVIAIVLGFSGAVLVVINPFS